MRRAMTVLLTMALLASAPLGAPASATANDGCTKGNVEGFANGGIAIAKQNGTNGTAAAWENCQFRFYDDNGPTTPHVFTDEEYFLGGIFNWFTDADIEEFDLFPRPVAVSDFDLLESTLFWRELVAEGEPEEEWEELELTSTAVRGVYAPFFGEVFHVMGHDYHIFEPGMNPGAYEWKWVIDAPWFPAPEIVVGEVLIVDA
jgi:hypothetical protein